jgi:hypothetical protein
MAAPETNYSIDGSLASLYVDAGGGVSYLGEAPPGTATSAAKWRIRRITTVGNDVTIEWADGNGNFDNVWDDRVSLSYS